MGASEAEIGYSIQRSTYSLRVSRKSFSCDKGFKGHKVEAAHEPIDRFAGMEHCDLLLRWVICKIGPPGTCCSASSLGQTRERAIIFCPTVFFLTCTDYSRE